MANFDNVFLTYANTNNTDGVGAQLHRIYGIYCLSRLLGTKYLHSPLHDVSYQGIDAVQNGQNDSSFVASFNQRFTLPSEQPTTTSPSDLLLPSLPVGRFERALGLRFGGRRKQFSPVGLSKFGRLVAGLSKLNAETVVRIGAPHALMDRYADEYAICKTLSPFRRGRPNDVLRIALHVRRGDIVFVSSERLIDNRYYVNIARRLSSEFARAQIPFEIELHSETLQKDLTVGPDDPAFRGLVDQRVQFRPEKDPFREFDVLPNLKRFINEPAMTCVERLATADILVTSKSSLSYLAGILNTASVVIYHPFWHCPLHEWVVTKPSGDFDVRRVMAHVRRLRSAKLCHAQ